jgi:hypothetical protein
MGLFSDSSTTESYLDLAGTGLEGFSPALAGEMMDLIGQEYLSPEQLVAALDPSQLQGINNMISGGQAQMDMSSALYGPGMQGLQGFGQGQNAMLNVLGQGPSQNMGINMGQIGQYINNDILQGQIDAASRDVWRGLNEQQMPAARLAMAGSGNTGSTRGEIGQAILERGAMDRVGDISAAMRGGAYGQALGIGAQQAAQNAQLGMGFQNLSANIGQNLMQGGMMGANLLNQGNMMYNMGAQNQIAGGGMLQAQEQAMLDANLQGFLFPYQQLQMLSGVGSNMANTFGRRVEETETNQGLGNTLVGIGAMAAGAMIGGPAGAAMAGQAAGAIG